MKTIIRLLTLILVTLHIGCGVRSLASDVAAETRSDSVAVMEALEASEDTESARRDLGRDWRVA
jgi:hypothetical protein